jgi:hypothetical protein
MVMRLEAVRGAAVFLSCAAVLMIVYLLYGASHREAASVRPPESDSVQLPQEIQYSNTVEVAPGNHASDPGAAAPLGRITAPSAISAAPTSGFVPSIKSEGFGPHIQAAIARQDPESALQAIEWLKLCRRVDGHVDFIFNHAALAKEVPSGLLVELRNLHLRHQRQCQTVTPDLYQREKALAELVWRSGTVGGAYLMLSALSYQLPASIAQPLLVDLMRDAQQRHPQSIHTVLKLGDAWGITSSELERLKVLEQSLDESSRPTNP